MRTIVKCIIHNKDKFLILERSNYKGEKNHKKWDLPGGTVNKQETVLDAIIRECREEININETQYKKISQHGDNKTFIFYLYELPYNDRPILLSDEHYHYKWIASRELSDYIMCSEEITLKNIYKFMKHN